MLSYNINNLFYYPTRTLKNTTVQEVEQVCCLGSSIAYNNKSTIDKTKRITLANQTLVIKYNLLTVVDILTTEFWNNSSMQPCGACSYTVVKLGPQENTKRTVYEQWKCRSGEN